MYKATWQLPYLSQCHILGWIKAVIIDFLAVFQIWLIYFVLIQNERWSISSGYKHCSVSAIE